MKKYIPNTITCANLFCGAVATDAALAGNTGHAALLIFLAAIFDFFDGMVARLLGVSSPMGKELDSLADVISFGMVPAAVAYVSMQGALHNSGIDGSLALVLKYFPFIIAVFSALRLAKFNIDTRQSDRFIGVPTPANALFLVSFVLTMGGGILPVGYFQNPYFIAILCLFCSLWLVMELPLLALKFKSFVLKGNEWRYALILIAVLLFIVLQLKALPFIVILYVLLSLLENILSKK